MDNETNIPNEEQTGRLQQTAVSRCAFMVLRGKEAGNVFWTSGGDYRTDWYDLLGEFDTEEAAFRLGLRVGSIRRVLRGDRNHYHGLKFMFT